jgi:putative ABC transport system permease protein
LLFGVTARDPLTYVAVAGLLAFTAILACIVPARQAMRVDVVSALRAE